MWVVEYYEQEDGLQPAEIFENWLDREHPRLAGKLLRLVLEVGQQGPKLGGGYLEPCHDFPGLWEVRGRHQKWLGRELLGFDGRAAILLHGYVKREGRPASQRDLKKAHKLLQNYLRTKRVSPEEGGQS
jgi:hypothetical protein